MSRLLTLTPGTPVRYRGTNYTIAHVLDFDSVLARPDGGGPPERLPVPELQPCSPEGADTTPDVDLLTISEEDWQEAERRQRIVRTALGLPARERTRTAMQAHAANAGINVATLYRWISRYTTTGDIRSLLPLRPDGGRGRSRLSEEIETIVSTTIEKEYLTKQKKDVQKVIASVHAACRQAGLDPPSHQTIRNRIRAISEKVRIAAREGRKQAEEIYGARPGRLSDIDTPLAAAQIDHTKLDLIVVDDVDRLPVGRPWITVLIDLFSRVILGFYLSLDSPGTHGTGLAIAHAVLPKENWLVARGLGGNWPCWGFPSNLMADNAGEFRGDTLRMACKQHHMNLDFRPVARPHYGAHIERLLGSLTIDLHAVPGTTFSNPTERGTYDSEGTAILTLSELESWIGQWITEIYHKRLHRGIGRTPMSLWEEGIRGNSSRTGIGLPPRVTDAERLRLDFMPAFERTVQSNGVTIDHVTYYDPVLRPYIGHQDPVSRRAKRKYLFRRDPRDISRVYFFDPVQQRYVAIPYRHLGRPAISIWEMNAARRALVEQGRAEIDEDGLFDAYARLRAREQEAARRTKETRRNAQRKRTLAASRERGESPTPPIGSLAPAPAKPASKDPAAPPRVPEAAPKPFTDYDPLEDLSWVDDPS